MRNRRSCRGQNLVEFALVLPILISMMLGIVDFGFIYFIRGSVENATREGARYGAIHAPITTADNIKTRIRQTVTGLDPSTLTIDVTCCDDSTCVEAPDATMCASGVNSHRVHVTVQYPLTAFWPFPASNTYQTSSTMRIENADPVS
jgi:Flp pilus assembly protein TadG